jgi:hypothetical protein
MVGNGAVAMQDILVSATAAKVAVSAGRIVIILDVVIVLAHESVKLHVSVYEPPQELCEPTIVD